MKRGGQTAICIAYGRMGNQLFLASFLDSILSDGDRVLSLGMGEFMEGFEWTAIDARDSSDPKVRKRFKRPIFLLGRLAGRLRLVDIIRQKLRPFETANGSFNMYDDEYSWTKGLLSRFVFLDRCYFQTPQGRTPRFRLKERHLKKARAFLERLPDKPTAFIHMRRGDYRNFSQFGQSPLLPVDYFKRGAEDIAAKFPDVQFILLSDTIEEAKNALSAENLHVFAGDNPYEDFGMMTLCDGGVMSNSTFSWWGGYFCRRRLPLVAPRGWMAPGLGFTYPPNIIADWMTPIDPVSDPVIGGGDNS